MAYVIAEACDAMAFYIKIEKYEETEFSAKYQFGSADGNCGEFEINKQSGEVRLLAQVSGDQQGHLFNRAAAKVVREWRQGRLPDMTEWAS
ncbi:hypothetical protein [Ralstonia pseudosolanacearum]|uniref:hypothetical protein n=1 Tax=Ralstonia pseudosolanacearum TaxID=1310165 RepID=UPI002675711B|nr:hypothetical protein [Ralstonia pseudosolanacearum]MDO3577425.1 hypothetical protein [Ralstonia pseudosolanacearum]MDO3586624.1 hypothetical protein [Ralstonia pseudosolanacearum]